ncbi:MAG: hypothetical protein WC302_02870 [Candidatus Paceibacterota bacterium]|jgi:hypothetical protein
MKLAELQEKYPKFSYSSYSFEISGKDLGISFVFKTGDIIFNPSLKIKNVPAEFNKRGLENLVFNLGIAEMISYWKSASSPLIEIECGEIGPEQKKFWKLVIKKGMGQFFFENKIKPFVPEIVSFGKKLETDAEKKNESYLVPVGGGKDSIVTLEILKKREKIQCFSLNPTESTMKVMEIAGCDPVIAERKIDSKLLELNQKGYLNGHTPFSAYLAFLAVLVAKVFNHKYIALSNERSAEEGNVEYEGMVVNHQWSKSYEFEKIFRGYCRDYLSREIEYFSFLRMFTELQIASMFAKYPQYFSSFLSCNEAHKTYSGTKKPSGKWCGECPKCLFAFLILYPFLDKEVILDIFGKNLFEDEKLIPVLEGLIGEREIKPFECVGTREESLTALNIAWEKNKLIEKGTQPALLRYFEEKILPKIK